MGFTLDEIKLLLDMLNTLPVRGTDAMHRVLVLEHKLKTALQMAQPGMVGEAKEAEGAQ